MSQGNQGAPSVTANIGGSQHQVNLRDWLNIRVAPFVKKAMIESLDAAPEFPLQWLGENLIHQSMLYEKNPDKTNIRERFLYNFEVTAPQPDDGTGLESGPSHSDAMAASSEVPTAPSGPGTNGEAAPQDISTSESYTNGEVPATQTQPQEQRDADMDGTS